jgi:hypothetical protein
MYIITRDYWDAPTKKHKKDALSLSHFKIESWMLRETLCDWFIHILHMPHIFVSLIANIWL